MNWHRTDQYFVTSECKRFTICKCYNGDEWKYLLYDDKKLVDVYHDVELAKRKANEIKS